MENLKSSERSSLSCQPRDQRTSPSKRLLKISSVSKKAHHSDIESEALDLDAPIVIRATKRSEDCMIASDRRDEATGSPSKFRRLIKQSNRSTNYHTEQESIEDSDYDLGEPLPHCQSSTAASLQPDASPRPNPEADITATFKAAAVSPPPSSSSSRLTKYDSQLQGASGAGAGGTSSPRYLGDDEVIDILFGEILREDRAEEFLQALFDDLNCCLITSPALAGNHPFSIPLYNLFLKACGVYAERCIELMIILFAMVGSQFHYPPKLTPILEQMIKHAIYPEQCAELLKTVKDANQCSDQMLIEWKQSQQISIRLQDTCFLQALSMSDAEAFIDSLSMRKIPVILVLCDYLPLYACKALRFPSLSSADTQLFDLITTSDAHLIPLLLHRIDTAIRRRYLRGERYVLETFKYRASLSSKLSDYWLVKLTSTEALSLVQVVDKTSGGMIIHWAAEEGLIDLVHELLLLLPSLGIAGDDSGMTILHSAAMMGHAALLAHIITHHFSEINKLATDKNDWTALMYAIYREQIACVRILLDNDAMNGEIAFRQMDFLDRSLPSSDKLNNPKMRKMIEALATIPEFRNMLNAAVRYALDCHIELNFIRILPSLLDTDNKLSIARRCFFQNQQLTITSARDWLYLARDDPWSSLLDFLKGAMTASGLPIGFDPQTYERMREEYTSIALRSLQQPRLMLQFADEVGAGPGIEKEVFELISEKLVHGSSKILRSAGGDSNIVIPMDSAKLQHPHIIPKVLKEIHLQQVAGGKAAEDGEEEDETSLADIVINASQAQSTSIERKKPTSYREHLSQFHQSLSDDSEDQVSISSSDDIEDDDDEDSEVEASSVDDNSSEATIPFLVSRPQPPWQHFYPDSYDSSVILDEEMESLESKLFALGFLIAHILIRRLLHAPFPASLSLDLPHAFWQLVLRRDISVNDIADLDADVYRNLVWLEEHNDVEMLSLTFSAVLDSSGDNQPAKVTDLVANGSEIDVTEANKQDYVLLMTRHCVCMRMAAQADHLRAGILRIFPEEVLDLFTAREIMGMVCGETAVVVEDWRDITTYSGGYDPNSDQIIDWFWEYVAELSPSQLSALLQFWTGSTRLPVGGVKNLKPGPCIMRKTYDASTALPTSATCFNMLKLPHYPEKHQLRKHLHTAIVYGSQGFAFT
jgi:hypothetical protein